MIQPQEAQTLIKDTHKKEVPPDQRAKLANSIRALVEEAADSLDASIKESCSVHALKITAIQCVFPITKILEISPEPTPLRIRTIAAVAEKEFRKYLSNNGWKDNILRITSEPLWIKQAIGNQQVIQGLRFTIVLEVCKSGEDTDFDELVIVQ